MTDITFLSHVARGFGAVADLDGADAQSTLPARLTVTAQPSGEPRVINKTVGLYRPCHVVGLEPGAIYRTDPDHRIGTTEFEPNYLAAVEFAASDLPWRFTSARGTQGRRTPWLALVVLADGEFEHLQSGSGGQDVPRPPSIRVAQPAVVLPPSDQLGAWAHAQAAGHLDDATAAELHDIDSARLDAIRSRLIAARRLRPRTRYTACVVPAYECGRRRGLDPLADHEHESGLSWSASTTTALDLPVYFSWTFTTSTRGDIEAVVKRLTPRVVDSTTGTRPLLVGEQQYGVPGTPEPLLYTGALVATDRPTPPPQPGDTTTQLIGVLNSPASLRTDDDLDLAGLPALAPPIYGQWHRPQHEIDLSEDPPSWVTELNRQVAHRSAAGLGAEIVRKHQEELASEAWRQVGDVVAASRRICAAQLGVLTATSLYQRSVAGLTDDVVVMMSRPVHAKIRQSGAQTMLADLEDTTLKGIAASARMRAAIAPRGALRRVFARAGVTVDPTVAVSTLAASTSLKAGFEAVIVDPALSLFIVNDEVVAVDNPPITNVPSLAAEIRSAVRPDVAIPARIDTMLDGVEVATAGALCDVVLPAPEFDTPMYAPLRDLAVTHLLPGIGDIEPNTVALLKSNSVFIESFMTGLNYEMAAELLWRGYPATDLRATYFRHFWESGGELPEIDNMHTWNRSLGENGPAGTSLVLLIRGDIIRWLPGVMIYAQRAVFDDGAYRLGSPLVEPIFRGELTADTVVIGFNTDEHAARGFVPPIGASVRDHLNEVATDPGYFFVLEEQPREPRFGLDEPEGTDATPPDASQPWQSISWADVAPVSHSGPAPWDGPIDLSAPTATANLPTDPPWNSTAAATARALFQQPYRIAIHAQRLLPRSPDKGGLP